MAQMADTHQPGTFERWALRGMVAAMVGLVSWIGVSAIDGQKDTSSKVGDLSSQMAVVSSQISALNANVNDVRELTRTVAQMQVRQAEHERRITELEHEKDNRR